LIAGLHSGTLAITGQPVDFKITGPNGHVIRDTKADRVDDHTAMLDAVAPKIAGSPTLRAMLDSYSRAVDDPGDELVHLYEIREALSKHYCGETAARDALGVNKTDWQRLGLLANVEPIEQGRHRGKHPLGRRPATSGELHEARALARRWIRAFARTILFEFNGHDVDEDVLQERPFGVQAKARVSVTDRTTASESVRIDPVASSLTPARDQWARTTTRPVVAEYRPALAHQCGKSRAVTDEAYASL
jgi:hypothetical protein